MKLQAKLISIIMVFIILTSGALVIQNSVSTKRIYNARLENDARDLINSARSLLGSAKKFDGLIEGILDDQILKAGNTLKLVDSKEFKDIDMKKIAKLIGADELNVIDSSRKIKFSNLPDNIGFKYPEDHGMSAVFTKKQDFYSEPARISDVDGKSYKYGGVNLGNGYFVQVGISAQVLTDLESEFQRSYLFDELVDENKGRLKYIVVSKKDGSIDSSSKIFAGVDTYTSELAKEVFSGQKEQKSFIDDKITGDESFIFCTPSKSIDGEDSVTTFALSTEIMHKNVRKDIIKSLVITVIIVLIAIVLIFFILKKILILPVKNVSNTMIDMSNYDFRHSSDDKIAEKLLIQKDELGDMSRAMDTMRGNISGLIAAITEKAQTTAATAEQLTATAQSTSDSANEVSSAVDNIAEGATGQAQDTSSAAESVSDTARVLSTMVEVLEHLSEAVKDINYKKDEGKSALSDLLSIADKNKESSNFVNQIILETNEGAEEISKASEMIQSIADQTNLLALNAAIEAARAGEAGKGFAVVAEEIRKLAEDSTKFTEEIRKIIDDLKEKTGKAVDAMDSVGKLMNEQNEKANITNSKFNEIAEAVEKSSTILNEVNDSSREIEEKNAHVTSVIENLSAIAQENAATSEEASASVELQVQSIADISMASENLAHLATELQEDVSGFKL